MILRDILIENWRCIRRLELTDLPSGLVILHGPNRTGKSSLVLALRTCLFDADHDAVSKEVRTSLPWSGNGPPRVAVGFLAGGATYRLTKVFSKKKDGTALLEKQCGERWQPHETAPKEASRRARELLGADKSTAGLNQLLWLTQGEVALPDGKDLDASLRQRLVGVLGVMMTARDIEFEKDLAKRSTAWFTETGRIKENCALSHLERRRVECLQNRDRERANWQRCEESVRRLQACQDELPSLSVLAERARADVERLTEEQRRCGERLRRHDAAQNAVSQAKTMLDQANAELATYRAAGQRCRDGESTVAAAQQAIAQAQAIRETRNRNRLDRAKQLDQARAAEDLHARERLTIDDCRKLVALAERLQQIDGALEALAKNEAQIADLERSLTTTTSPEEAALNDLRANRRRAEKLKAQLEAGLLTVTVTLRQVVPLAISVDGKPAEAVEPTVGHPLARTTRQHAEIKVADIGTIRLARAHADADLDRVARELTALDREFDEQVRSFHEDPADGTCLDRLLQRRLLRQNQSQRLGELRAKASSLAPEGRGAALAGRETLRQQQRLIHERRPDLADWQSSAAELDAREHQFSDRSRELEMIRKPLEEAARSADAACAQAQADWQACKDALTTANARANAARDELRRLGDEAALTAKVAGAADAFAEAERASAASQLTEAERNIDRRLAEANAAHAERQKRLRESEDEILGLRRELQGDEGLHARLMDAETQLAETETKLAREKLEADAHKRLRDLFAACRENQVQQVMGPVAQRVLDWCHTIGLRDFREVRFADQFLPEGVAMAGSNGDETVVIGQESHGTQEQLGLLVRLALGGMLAKDEPAVAILDDPLVNTDAVKHRAMLPILRLASEGGAALSPPAGPLQIIILTCHPDCYDHIPGAAHINLEKMIAR